MKCARTKCTNPADECCIHTQTDDRYCRSCAHKINVHHPGLVIVPVVNRCPVSYDHLPHDFCDGTPADTRPLPKD